MDLPKPLSEHRKLERLTGTFRGDEQLFASRWFPQGGKATSRWTARLDLGGFWLIGDYEQTRDGKVAYRGHGLYGYDAERQRYIMYWFDSMSSKCEPMYGVMKDDTLVFDGEGAHGHNRNITRFAKDGSWSLRLEHSKDGELFEPLLEGTYKKA